MSESNHEYKKVTRCQSVAAVLWPSFLAAGLATIFFFAFVDPADITLKISSMAVYSLGFFAFWVISAASSCATQYFLKPCELVNRNK